MSLLSFCSESLVVRVGENGRVTPSTPPHEQLPPVQKLRVRFAKRGRLRYTSHRDFQRGFERALRRSGVPVAYSQGFTPHPKVSYAGAAPTGAISEAEYLELSMTRRCVPSEVGAALDEVLPPGLDIVEVVEAGSGALADRLQASVWHIELPDTHVAQVGAALRTFLSVDSVPVERLTKNGVRVLDARAAVLAAEAVGDEPPAIRLTVRHQSPTVRPEEVMKGLEATSGFIPSAPIQVTRLEQGIFTAPGSALTDPLEPDRAGGGGDPADAGRPGST